MANRRPIASGLENNPEHFRWPADQVEQAIARDPYQVFFTLPEIMRVFGLSPDELRRELASGRLTASGTPNDTGGYHNVAVTFPALVEWLVATGRSVPEVKSPAGRA